jgi:hypothetical protein
MWTRPTCSHISNNGPRRQDGNAELRWADRDIQGTAGYDRRNSGYQLTAVIIAAVAAIN